MTAIKRPVLPLTGGCACGAIRYEITAMPYLLYACHCTECQRRSGSAFALNMPVATETLRIVKGTPKAWRYVGASGTATINWFCADCGGRIYGERDGRPEAMTIRAGSLDDTSWLRPAAHFFMRSAQPWETIEGECYDTAATDFIFARPSLAGDDGRGLGSRAQKNSLGARCGAVVSGYGIT